MPEFRVGDTLFARNASPVVVAELGINHEGSLKVAIEMADAAIFAGVRFIKHQTHIPDAEMSEEAKLVKPGNADQSIYEVVSRCALSESDEFALKEHVEGKGAIFFSTPFSREAADRLAQWNLPLYKIGSGECNNYPLVEYVANLGKPIILSTGMNTLASIRRSAAIIAEAGVPYALLHTTNLYPTPHHLLRLGGLTELGEAFPQTVIGLSDHSTSNNACIAAVALGARILERHFTDRRNRPGPDISCSMSKEEATELLVASEEVFLASGGSREPALEEAVTMAFAFASVVATRNLRLGDVLNPENIWVKRPSGGDFDASELEGLYGQVVQAPVAENTQLMRAHLELPLAGDGL